MCTEPAAKCRRFIKGYGSCQSSTETIHLGFSTANLCSLQSLCLEHTIIFLQSGQKKKRRIFEENYSANYIEMPPKPPACSRFAVQWIWVWIMALHLKIICRTNPSPKTHIWVSLVHFWISKAAPGLTVDLANGQIKRSGLDSTASVPDQRW